MGLLCDKIFDGLDAMAFGSLSCSASYQPAELFGLNVMRRFRAVRENLLRAFT